MYDKIKIQITMEITEFEVSTYNGLTETKEVKTCKIPRDEKGEIIGVPWKIVRERMYDNLSKHYGVDLKTL